MACVNELMKEQETAEDGNELKSTTEDGRKDFKTMPCDTSEEQQETKGLGDCQY